MHSEDQAFLHEAADHGRHFSAHGHCVVPVEAIEDLCIEYARVGVTSSSSRGASSSE